MGIGTLRRYHDDSRLAGLTPLDEGAVDAAQEEAAAHVGAEEELERNRALNEAAAKLTEAKAAAFDALTKDGDADAAGAQLAEAQEAYDKAWAIVQADGEVPTEAEGDTRPEVEVRGAPEGDEPQGDQEPTLGAVPAGDATAGAVVAAQAAEDAGVEQPSTEELGSKHGDLEQPSRGASTADWVAYAEADPNGAPLDLTPRTGLRDEIAQHYLGKA